MVGCICQSPNILRLKELKDEMGDRCKVYCETGVLYGWSMILQMKSERKCLFIGIDLYTGYYGNAYDPHRKVDLTNHMKIASDNIDKNNHNNHNYQLIKGDSKDPKICDNVKHIIDFLFIDGDHSTNGVKRDFLNLKDKVNIGGLIVFDNYNDSSWRQVKPEADRLAELYKKEFKIKETFGHMLVLEKIN